VEKIYSLVNINVFIVDAWTSIEEDYILKWGPVLKPV
jgi:hypothetical protein